VFDDAYRSGPELRTLVRGADVVVLPYDSHDQVTSGVLVEAIAAARPVVATAFPHAVELLGGGAGIVVRHGDPDALASGIRRVLTTPRAAIAMRERCRAMAADLAWPAVGARYARLATEVLAARAAA
jgi:glycosyltransferase involved in cell wall biosynthesis